MTVFISGGAKNGKSSLAQELALTLARGGRRYSVATMIPVDDEDRERIRRHIADRDGLPTAVCDYIAGMTDRYAVMVFQQLTIPKNWSKY